MKPSAVRMHASRSSLIRNLSWLMLCACAAQSWGQSSAARQTSAFPSSSYSVLYTGKLSGYFRYPEVQELHLGSSVGGCDAEAPLTSDGEPEAYEFQEFMNRLPERPDALVSTGDNFAPFLLSREAMLFNQKGDPPKLEPKSNYDYDGVSWVATSWDNNPSLAEQLRGGNGTIPQDNVACFLRRMHFDAIVPGRNDFYFGPERLRQLARLLAKDDPKSCPEGAAREPGVGSCPVAMLAANLFIKTQLTGSPEALPQGYSGRVHAAIPKLVTPWMRRIILVGMGNDVTIAPAIFLRSACYAGTIPMKAIQSEGQDGIVYAIPPDAPKLDVNKQEVLSPDCTYFVGLGSLEEPMGQFTVAYPFFTNSGPSSSAARRQPFDSKSLMWPWKMVPLRNAGNLAIFGIVDRNLAVSIGKMNYTWLGTEDSQDQVSNEYESVVYASDPAEALKQALEYCEQVSDCRAAHKLVLAQMHEDAANQELGFVEKRSADSTPLEVVITDADPDRATGNQRTELRAGDNNDRTWSRPTVLVPGTHSQAARNPYELHIRLQSATVTPGQTSRTIEHRVFVDEVAVVADPLGNQKELACKAEPCPTDFTTLRAELNRAMRDNKAFFHGLPALTPEDTLGIAQQIALQTMRTTCHSDVALLQARDVSPSSAALLLRQVSAAGLKAAVSALFWKGDFIQCLTLPGETLVNLLKRSEELKHQEETGLATELSKGWWLLRAGVEPVTPNLKIPRSGEAWLVNGSFLDVKKLYSVAATDYIANGDTGYPALQNAEPEPNVPLPTLRIYSLTDQVAAMLGFGQSEALIASGVLDRLDRSNQKPAAVTATTFAGWLESWTKLNAFSSPAYSFETHQQQHPVTSLKLYKLDFTYALFQHNGTEKSIAQSFPGVTGVDLSNTANFAYGADYQIRAERTGTRFGSYFESDLNVGRNAKRSSFKAGATPCFPGTLNTCYQVSQTANYWYQEGGLAVRLAPVHQNPSGLKLILPIGFKTQLFSPYTQIVPLQPAPPGKTAANASVLVTAPRNYYLAFRPGLRFEHSFPRGNLSTVNPTKGKLAGPAPGKTFNSYVETGFQAGQVFNSPSVYQFGGLSGSSNSAVCPETNGFVPASLLATCLTQTSVLNAATPLVKVIGGRNFGQEGLYLNARLDMPIPGKSNAEFLIENRGDFFFRRPTDLSMDTHFLDDLSLELLFPVWGRVSVGPVGELIFFETKGTIPGNYYFSYATSVAVTYSFEWRPGLKWAKSLRYGSSDPPAQPLPSR